MLNRFCRGRHYDKIDCLDNRKNGGIQHDYDIMIGPVANDDTMVTVNRFVQGIYTAEEAISRLRFSKANDQVTFHTE